ncbi:hypothetical protein GCM10025298_07520 [Natronobiforma cellulositropha]
MTRRHLRRSNQTIKRADNRSGRADTTRRADHRSGRADHTTRRSGRVTRRAVLGCLAAGSTGVIGGCLASSTPDVFETVAVEGTDLVVDVDDSALEQLSVIRPDGTLLATRTLPAGVRRETVTLGTSYLSGTYELIALEGGGARKSLVRRFLSSQRSESSTSGWDETTPTRCSRGRPETIF